ncbi:MAG: hypothetical protein LUH17_02380 [Acidaminococcaceae bacterium]|nr:hypothetical protein [Acidaminococcaceae bacterium]
MHGQKILPAAPKVCSSKGKISPAAISSALRVSLTLGIACLLVWVMTAAFGTGSSKNKKTTGSIFMMPLWSEFIPDRYRAGFHIPPA